jgi:hypothetical protein
MALASPPQSTSRLSLFEAAFLLLIAGATLSLLLPSLAVSRENARANLCRRNLRRLDLTAADYMETQRRLPDAQSWPIDLLPRLQELVGTEKTKFGANIFTAPIPDVLTCPSQLSQRPAALHPQTSHYVLIVDRDPRTPWSSTTWRFRDREMNPPAESAQPWCVGVELTSAAAATQLRTAQGPHARHSFLESDAQGGSQVVGGSE